MGYHGYIVALGFITSFVVVLLTTPSLIKVARMKHLVDEPGEERKVHSRSVPTIGGIIIFAGIIFSYAMWFPVGEPIDGLTGFKTLYLEMGTAYKEFKYLLAAMVLLFFMGVKDDIIGFSPVKKLLGHFIIGYILVMMADIRITSLYGMFGVYEMEPHVSMAFSFFVYIVLVNAINLIDGVDGLAAGIGLIASVAFGTWFYFAGNVPDTLLSAVLAGALAAFLIFNSSPARVFMGDSGSLIIGAIITVLAMKMIESDPSTLPVQIRDVPKPIFAMAVIAYPLIDTFRIFIYRMSKGNSPFAADRNHIHHRLMKLGAGHKMTVAILYTYTLVMIGISGLMGGINITYGLLITGGIGFLLLFIPFIIKPKKAE